MTKREKIIVALAMAAMAYGGYVLFTVWEGKKPPVVSQGEDLAALRELAVKSTEELKKDALSEAESHILARAEKDWPGDPFLGRKLATRTPEPLKGPEGPAMSLTYSGFIESGKKRLAIINGLEYKIGEQLETGDYIVLSIEPESVVLEHKGRRDRLVVPFIGEAY